MDKLKKKKASPETILSHVESKYGRIQDRDMLSIPKKEIKGHR